MPRPVVFISHASDDAPTAEKICKTLEPNGITCWMAPRDIKGGEEWADSVVSAIKACRVMVVVVSANCNQSDGVKDEIQQGVKRHKTIVPYRIDDSELSPALDLHLRRRQWLTANRFDNNGVQQLLDHLRHRFRTEPPREAPPVDDSPPQLSDSGTRSLSGFDNPYRFDATATPLTFKGREAELDELIDSIEMGTHTAIFGLQRMGKTSLIGEGLRERLAASPELSNSVLFAKVDLQALSDADVTYREFLHAIVTALTNSAATFRPTRAGGDLRALTNELFASGRFSRGDRTEMFTVFAKVIREFASVVHRRVVLFIDEFSEVRKVIERTRQLALRNPGRTRSQAAHEMFLDVAFLHHLGALLRDHDAKDVFTLIVAVRPFMAEFDKTEELQLLKLMKPITLYYLDERAAKSLITEPVKGRLVYENGAVEYLYRLTSGHPYLLQFILSNIVSRMKRRNCSQVRISDIVEFEKRMTGEGPAYDAHFHVLISDYSVDEVRSRDESLLGNGTLAIVAKFGNEQREGWVQQEQIFEELLRRKIPKEKAASLLSQLTRTRILEESSQNGRLCFRLSVPLLRKRFVSQNLYEKYFASR